MVLSKSTVGKFRSARGNNNKNNKNSKNNKTTSKQKERRRLTIWEPSKPCGTNSCTSAIDQSGVPTSCRGVLAFEPLPVSGVFGAGTGDAIREAAVLGWNGAALAALGEMVVDFFGAEAPLPDRREGVKLGESTLKRFLLLNYRNYQHTDLKQSIRKIDSTNLSD